MANAQGGSANMGVRAADRESIGVPANRIGEAVGVFLQASRLIIRPELVLYPPEPEIHTLRKATCCRCGEAESWASVSGPWGVLGGVAPMLCH